MTMVKVEGTSFVRDINSMGLSNTDTIAKNDYYAKLGLLKRQKEELNTVWSEIQELRSDMNTIKSLLHQLVEKG